MHVHSAGKSGWLCKNGKPVESVCSWEGVTCVNGAVTEIHLPGDGIRGTLPSSLAKVLSLSVIELTNNQLTGSLPQAYCDASQLQSFQVSVNRFSCYSSCMGALSSFQTDSSLISCTDSPTIQPSIPSSPPTSEPTLHPSKCFTSCFMST